ncbi:DUF3488 and transglutaminase-like domain-containing protein [Luteimonas pelagia]
MTGSVPAATIARHAGRLPLDDATRGWTFAATAACLAPLLLQLPLRFALPIAVVCLAMMAVAWRRTLPGALRMLLTLLLVGAVLVLAGFSVGRDTGSALLAAMLAVKPLETLRLRDARSLVGFALFAPFATFLLDQGPLSLVLGLVAATLALAAMHRLADLASGVAGPRRSVARQVVRVLRLAAMGLPLALAVFWLFPRLSAPLWGVPDRALSRPGLSGEMSPGGWIDLLNDDTPALRAEFDGAAPDPAAMYWRGPVLWDFDGRTWRQPEWLQGRPAPDVAFGRPTWSYRLELEATEGHQLVALDVPRAAPEGARLSADFGLYVPRPLVSLTRWELQSAPVTSHASPLSALQRRRALALPDGLNPRAVALGRQWREEAGPDDRAIIGRALEWVRNDFAYTLAVDLPGRHAVDEFLFESREGYCEHFSSSFTVLMRAAGIPARVVTGYAGGYYNRIGGYWLVRRADAHAWSEVWLDGRGWVRVDPTAAVAPERVFDTIADRDQAGGLAALGGVGGSPALDVADWLRRGWNNYVLGFDAARQRDLLRPLGVGASTTQIAMLFVLAAVLALGAMAWLVARERRESDPVLRAWHRLGGRYGALGLARRPDEPALQWARRVADARPGRVSELNALTRRFVEWRYARDAGDARAARDLVRDLRSHRPRRTD